MLSASNKMQMSAAVCLAATRWHHRVWAQYKVAVYFSHILLLTGEQEVRWLRLDAQAAKVAPNRLTTTGLNKWHLSCWQVPEEKRGGQFCHFTPDLRVGPTFLPKYLKLKAFAVLLGSITIMIVNDCHLWNKKLFWCLIIRNVLTNFYIFTVIRKRQPSFVWFQDAQLLPPCIPRHRHSSEEQISCCNSVISHLLLFSYILYEPKGKIRSVGSSEVL